MPSASLSAMVEAPITTIRDILLAAPLLPAWNPAFVRLSGPARATQGTDYALEIIRGLHGTLHYSCVDHDEITMSWRVPLLAETGTWQLAEQTKPSRTLVTHTVERRGALASILRQSVHTLPRLRLERLVERAEAQP